MRHAGFALTLSQACSFRIRLCPRHLQSTPFHATGEWHQRDHSSLFGTAPMSSTTGVRRTNGSGPEMPASQTL
jgi:hypothetical protein